MMPTKAEIQLLTAILSIASSLDIEILAIGANARQLILDERFKLTTQRLTTDWDFAVQVDSWASYFLLSQALIKESKFKKISEHRFLHIATNIPIDMVPFGHIAEPNQRIEWPDSEKQMSVLGFHSAYYHGQSIQLNGQVLKVVTIPWHVALKLMAYKDRKLEKDLFDIHFILEHATEVFSERVFDELADALAEGRLDYDQAGAFLLGRDLANQATTDVISVLSGILSNLINDPNHIDFQRHLLRMQHEDQSANLVIILQRFKALKQGLDEA